jgi:hypothetical protein
MRTNLSPTRLLFGCLPLVLWCACGASVFAQGGKGVPSPTIIPAQPVAPAGGRIVGPADAPRGWMRYEFQFAKGNVVSLVLPANIEATNTPVPVGDSPPAINHLYSASGDESVCVFVYLEGLPAAISDNPGAQSAFFQGLWTGFAEGVRAEMRKGGLDWSVEPRPAREIAISGMRAQVSDFAIGKYAGTARAVIGGGYAYVVFTVSRAESLNAESTAFLNSFALRSHTLTTR